MSEKPLSVSARGALKILADHPRDLFRPGDLRLRQFGPPVGVSNILVSLCNRGLVYRTLVTGGYRYKIAPMGEELVKNDG